MLTTTQPQIHAHFRAVIEAITPRYEYLRDVPWAYVEELPGEVSGPEIRCFTLDMTVAEPVPDGLFSLGEEYSFDLEIHVAYGALPKEHAPWIITSDAVDLRTVLLAQLAPTLEGLLSVRRVGFAPISNEEGHWYGSHVFEIHYMEDTGVDLPPSV
ncbi:hypothetical protein [Nannocystis pusilla]|uniref:hypothetical protein n=1 Tax=Nannocystis pusilla TaxID=889268 RepID=UPI003DA65A40